MGATPSEAADLVAPSAELEELRQAHTSEEVAASADLEPQLDVVVLPFSRLSKSYSELTASNERS